MKLKYLYLLSIIFIAVSCHDDHLGVVEEPSHSDVADGNGIYLNLNIASVDCGSGSRADEDFVNYKDYPHETTILKGRVYIYEGDSEDDAVCVTSANLNIGSYEINETTQFATEAIPIRNIELGDFQYESGKKYFALVILNANDNSEEDDRYKIESVTFAPFVYPKVGENEKFKTWATTAQSSPMTIQKGEYKHPNHNKNFVAHYPTMTNATGMTGYSSGKNFRPVTLVQISNEDFTTTKVDNTYKSKTLIYLQRNIARVVLQPRIKNGGNDLAFEDKKVTIIDPDNQDEWTAEVNISNWCLDIINYESYPVMNVADIAWDKFAFRHIGDSEYERSGWSRDPNYDIPSANNNKFIPAQNWGSGWTDARVPLYCLENTFAPSCMLQGQTTRAIMRGRWAFEEIKKDELKELVKLPEGENGTCYASINAPAPNNNSNTVGFYLTNDRNKVWCRAHIEEALTAKAKELYGEAVTLRFYWKTITAGGYFTLKDLFDKIEISIIDNPSDSEYTNLTDAQYDNIAPAIGLQNGTKETLNYYYNSVSFYAVRIPHFKWADVPWDEETEVKTKTDGTRIAAYEPKHLGRYGVVRNYSYVISVNGIHNIGEPTLPPYNPDDTDDMPGPMYLDVEVKVQAWAKHDITVGF